MFRISGLRLRYPGSESDLLEDVSIVLKPGELLFLKGPNGSGKTSLLNAISGVIPHFVKAELEGGISLEGIDLTSIPFNQKFRHLAYQMGDPESQIFFPSLEKEISFGLENLGLPVGEMRSRIDAAAGYFGLQDFLRREPEKLSRGEKKLLVLAVCAALNTPLILLDEPASSLDEFSLELLKAWLLDVKKRGGMVIAADHDPRIGALADQTLELTL